MTTQHESSWPFLGIFIVIAILAFFYGLSGCDDAPRRLIRHSTDTLEVVIDPKCPPCDEDWVPPGLRADSAE